MDSRSDLLSYGRRWQFEPGHHYHIFESREGVARIIGVTCCHRSVVTGIHRLQHIESFRAAALSYDDAVRAHSQGIDYEVAYSNSPLSFDVGGSGFQPAEIFVAEFEFSGVFHGYYPFFFGDKL